MGSSNKEQLFQSQARSWDNTPTPRSKGQPDQFLAPREKAESLGQTLPAAVSSPSTWRSLLHQPEPWAQEGKRQSWHAGLHMAHITCSVVEREAVIHHIVRSHAKTVKN